MFALYLLAADSYIALKLVRLRENRMKGLIGVILMLSAFSSSAITIVGDDAYPPYSFKENGKVTGIYTDIIQRALLTMNNSSVISLMPWKRGLSSIKSKAIDALFPPYYRPKQRPYMSYSTDILNETPVIFCNAEVAGKLKNFPNDYQGIRLGRNSGFISGEDVDKAVEDGIIMVFEAKGMAANLKKLISKRVDCYLNDRLSILYELKKMTVRGEYEPGSVVETYALASEKGYLAINSDASLETKMFMEEFNSVIEEMKASGKIDEIVTSYTRQ